MHIDSYRFGRVDIDHRTYHSDVIVSPDGVDDRWWRHDGHSLAIEDLAGLLAARPDIVVIGTGYFGRMAVPDELRQDLERRGLQVVTGPTRRAIAEFNRLQSGTRRVAAALHVTC
jgi:hypothetical protein